MDATGLVESEEGLEYDLPAEDQQSSSSLPLLTSAQPPPPLVITQERKRIGWHLLLTTLALVALSAGLAIALLTWVIYIHGVPTIAGKSILMGAIETGGFIVDEGTVAEQDSPQTATLHVLTFSSVTTQMVSLTAPLLVMMAAYCTVGSWLSEQEQLIDDGEGLPTPAQFGFLVKLSSTTGIVSIYETVRYLIAGAREKRRESIPVMFYAATIGVVGIYSVTHLISGADLWLHLSSSAILRDTSVPISSAVFDFSRPLPPDAYPLGVTFNNTLCRNVNFCIDMFNDFSAVAVISGDISINVTYMDKMPADGPGPHVPISVITLHDEDDLAVIVPSPGSYDKSLSWTASSYGLRVSCRSITEACESSRTSYDCTSAGYPGFPSSITQKAGPSLSFNNGSGISDDIFGYYQQGELLQNPYNLLFEYLTQYPSQPFTGALLPYNGSFVNSYGVGFAVCRMDCFNLTIRHNGTDQYSVVDGSMERSSDAFAAIMTLPQFVSDGGFTTAIVDSLLKTAQNDDNLIAGLNQGWSQGVLGTFAGAVIPIPAFTVSKPTLLSRYSTLPLLTYVSFLFLYSVLVLWIFTWASTIDSPIVKAQDGKETTLLKPWQSLLTDSLTLVGFALPQTLHGLDEGPLLKKKPVDMFGEVSPENEDLVHGENGHLRRRAPRLVLDVVDEGPKAGMMFGVREWKPED